MNTVIINGQNHKGSTHMVARELAEKVGGEITEFFLPRDFNEPCTGCFTCFNTDLTHCPHYAKLRPINEAIEKADLIILASPVYVFHATGQMMCLLDHFGTCWMVHRPKEMMFKKQGVCISTAAGGGMKSTNKDMADSLTFWGIPKIYKLGFGVQAVTPEEIPDKIMERIHRQTSATAKQILTHAGKTGVSLTGRFWFTLVRMMHKQHIGQTNEDYVYWEKRGWHGKGRPWRSSDSSEG